MKCSLGVALGLLCATEVIEMAGVWTLPPTYRLTDQDQARYQVIGESDRYALRFATP